MKYLFVFALLGGLVGAAQAQSDFENLTAPGRWTFTGFDTLSQYNDVWGYAADGREYAILGSAWGTHILEVTNPAAPVEILSEPGAQQDVIWRDFKTRGHYLYGTADFEGNSLQIFDLQFLPDSVVKVYDSDSLSESAHNLFIAGDLMYLADNKRGGVRYPMEVFSLANDPTQPELVFTLNYQAFLPEPIHDVHVRNDTAYLSAGFSGMLVYDFSTPTAPVLISTLNAYTAQGYNHSSWLTDDGRYLLVADEVPFGLPLKLFDISDLDNWSEVALLQSNPFATPHNPFIRNDTAFVAYYLDGVQVFDLSDPADPQRLAFYDTYPDNPPGDFEGYQDFDGCWGVYPFLPSGRILASDITYGLFVLELSPGVVSQRLPVAPRRAAYPNPARTVLHAFGQAPRLHNALGQPCPVPTRLLAQDEHHLDVRQLPTGWYVLRTEHRGQSQIQKIWISR